MTPHPSPHPAFSDGKPICVWESASIALYLCKKHGKFIPKDPRLEVEMTNWIFWQVSGSCWKLTRRLAQEGGQRPM